MSGDLGRLDANGNLQIVGRMKDLIIRGGHNIHPARIEDLAHRHPGDPRPPPSRSRTSGWASGSGSR